MPNTVSINDATVQQLRQYARNVLNLEFAQTENSNSLRNKITQAMPGVDDIRIPLDGENGTAQEVVKPATQFVPSITSTSPSRNANHFGRDPRVELKIMPSADPTRSKDVQIAVNGDVIILQRNKLVNIPYRHYLALCDAVETVAVDSDEINPITGMPKKNWEETPSYPFQVYAMPSEEEIAAWEKRTAAIEMA